MPIDPSIAARQGSRPRKEQMRSATHTSSDVPVAMRRRATRSDCRSSLSGSPSAASDRTSPIAPPPFLRRQYSTGSGSSERQRYQVATERHGRQVSPSAFMLFNDFFL